MCALRRSPSRRYATKPGDLCINLWFMVHPVSTTWQDKYTLAWAKAHPKQIKRAESATELEVLYNTHQKEVIDTYTSATNTARKTYDYVGKYYDSLFPAKPTKKP